MSSTLAKIFGFSQTLAGFVRVNFDSPVVTLLRTVRDIEDDAPRTVSEIFIPGPPATMASDTDAVQTLLQIPSAALPVAKPLVFDVSPSGLRTVACTMTSATPPAMFVEVNSPDRVFKIDTTDLHGKFVGDNWFGGASWSSDERYVCYVAQPKQAKKVTSFEDGSGGANKVRDTLNIRVSTCT